MWNKLPAMIALALLAAGVTAGLANSQSELEPGPKAPGSNADYLDGKDSSEFLQTSKIYVCNASGFHVKSSWQQRTWRQGECEPSFPEGDCTGLPNKIDIWGGGTRGWNIENEYFAFAANGDSKNPGSSISIVYLCQ